MKTLISTFFIGLIFLTSCGTSNVKEPEYRDIREVRMIELGVLQSTAGIYLIYYNPNNFGVQLSDLRGDVYVDNVFFGRLGLNERVNVKKRSEFIVPAIIKLDMIGAVKNQRDLFKKKEALVRIDGMARVSKSGLSRDLPIRFERMENIERFRSLVAR
ncbi:MAG: LEA type 2 family protein [Chitinophagaceae bacterium]